MTLRIEVLKVTFGTLSSAAIALLGENYKLVTLLVTLIILDTLLGNLWAKAENEWKSTIARKGIYSKLCELVLVALMYMCEWTFEINWLANAVIIYFSVCEGASVLENMGKFNSDVPQEAINFFAKVKQNLLTKFTEWIRDFFGGGDSG